MYNAKYWVLACVMGVGYGAGVPSPTSALASEQEESLKYFTMGKPIIKEITDLTILDRFPLLPQIETPEIPNTAFDGSFNFSNIVNLGEKLWQLVLAGKPVAHVQTATASALPEGTKSWESLEGWQTPVSKVFQITFQNGYRRNIVDFTYRLLYTYGGNIKGKGNYLTNIAVVPADLTVGWGYSFSAQVQVQNVTNAGTLESPIGAVELLVSWKVDTIVRHMQGSSSFYIKGDGSFRDLSGESETL